MISSTTSRCGDCGCDLAPGALMCPSCRRLVHADEMNRLAGQAEAAEQAGNVSEALSAWRHALEKLPPDSKQHGIVLARVRQLSEQVENPAPPPAGGSGWKKGLAGAGGILALLLKVKTPLIFLATKGKFLLLGLTKWKTLLSMFVYFGFYWTLFGWKFALGFAVSIYIHEMGHVWLLNRYGIKATAPMFIPMFGAYVRGQHYPTSLIEIARVGLAGPIWGMGAALVCYGLFLATDNILWGALAQTGAMINLLNMIPVWQLDGAAGFTSLTRGQRLLASAAAGALLMFTIGEGHMNIFLLLITLFGLGKSFIGEMPARRDDYGLFQYVMLLIVLGMLATIQLPGVHF